MKLAIQRLVRGDDGLTKIILIDLETLQEITDLTGYRVVSQGELVPEPVASVDTPDVPSTIQPPFQPYGEGDHQQAVTPAVAPNQALPGSPSAAQIGSIRTPKSNVPAVVSPPTAVEPEEAPPADLGALGGIRTNQGSILPDLQQSRFEPIGTSLDASMGPEFAQRTPEQKAAYDKTTADIFGPDQSYNGEFAQENIDRSMVGADPKAFDYNREAPVDTNVATSPTSAAPRSAVNHAIASVKETAPADTLSAQNYAQSALDKNNQINSLSISRNPYDIERGVAPAAPAPQAPSSFMGTGVTQTNSIFDSPNKGLAESIKEAATESAKTPSGKTDRLGAAPTQGAVSAMNNPNQSKTTSFMDTAGYSQTDRTGNRGWRNNNPGNIEASAWTRGQPGYIGTDNRFAIFDTVENGVKAQAALLGTKNYANKTIAGAISVYAPEFENNTKAYANSVAAAVGVPVGTKMSDLTPQQREDMVSAMHEVEGSTRPGSSRTSLTQKGIQARDNYTGLGTGSDTPSERNASSRPSSGIAGSGRVSAGMGGRDTPTGSFGTSSSPGIGRGSYGSGSSSGSGSSKSSSSAGAGRGSSMGGPGIGSQAGAGPGRGSSKGGPSVSSGSKSNPGTSGGTGKNSGTTSGHGRGIGSA